jgi:predicted pore-forming effector associated with SMODS systems
MHTYARNCTFHPTLIALISLVSIALALLIGYFANQVSRLLGIPLSGVSAISIFGLLWLLFDRCLWKVGFVRSVLLVPDLNGTWKCTGRTVTKGTEKVDYQWEATITICQSWSKMLVRQETSQSGSKSVAASLYHEGDKRYRLIYHYTNDPKPSELELRRHSGLTDLLFDTSVKTAQGRYFTDGDRLTVGEMSLTRIGEDHEHTAKT